ncbi:SgcJ/EcaC family oxidoreductase [Amycolatopsis palatopharyngis]|uniref:SgcJ/EcaC family oxidoreductase n=1 Tax=Amycolatopsis palatopharyngis TaxID=187982 RepID=UPI000E23A351|nr:SgcJ/EcaC family oxidoreductase [Amycolatopsis palatopharyngis]
MTTVANAGPTDADKAAVADLPSRIVQAWAAHDADAFAGVFTEDGSIILPGVYRKGRDEIRSYMAEAFAQQYKGTQVTGQPIDLRFFDSECALLITQGGVLGPGETEVSAAQAIRASWLVVKHDGEWHLAAYQNSPRDGA